MVRAAVPLVMVVAGGAAANALGSTPQAKKPTTTTTTKPAPTTTESSPPPVTPPPAAGPQTVDYGYDAAHDFAAADPSITLPLGARWSVATPGDPVALLAADNLDFALVDAPSAAEPVSATIEALDPGTGATKWSRPAPPGAAIAYESGILAVAGAGQIQAYSYSTGAPLWTLSLLGVDAITPADGELYADAAGGPQTAQTIDAVNVATGKVDWSAQPPNAAGAGPLGVSGDRVYRSESTQWQAFDRRNGKLIWHQSNSSAAGLGETATLWQTQMFRVGFTPGLSLPGTILDGGPVAAATGQQVPGAPAEIVSGNIGLQTRGTGVAASNLNSNSVLWGSLSQPLAILNGDAIMYSGAGIALTDLNSGRSVWSAQLSPPANATPTTAVGNGELLIGAGGHVTALVPSAFATHTAKLSIPTQYWVYGGRPATGSVTVSEPGLEVAQQLAMAPEPWPFKHFRTSAPVTTDATGRFPFRESPTRDTIYRVSLRNSTQALELFEIVVLPHVSYDFLRSSVSHRRLHGNVSVKVVVPPSIGLAHHPVNLYLGVMKHKQYVWLGRGTLRGSKGHFSARFPFKLEHHVAKQDFVTACFVGIYKQGMSFGDRLDRGCGASKIHF